MVKTWFVVMSVVGGCAVARPVLADIINVPADQPTIQAGIDAAVDGDEVVVADGTYTGDGNRDMDFGGKAIMVRSENGPGECIIDLQADENDPHRAFTFQNGETAESVVQGFTIQNGFMSFGGAVRCIHSSPEFRSCVFQHNEGFGGAGGAVYNFETTSTFFGCQFIENHAKFGGGAVAVISGCEAGAGFCSRSEFYGCLFSGNTATDPESSVGGAVLVGDVSSAEFVNCTFVGNQADQGGALWAAARFSNAIVVNCTFVGNQADQGSALLDMPWTHGGGPFSVVDNSILWDNSPEVIVGTQISVRYSDVQGSWEGIGNIDADPLFVDPTNGDFRLAAGSPCIDAADNTAVPKGITTDLDGNPRFIEEPDTPDTGLGDCPIVDMGSYEFQEGTRDCCPWDLDGGGFVGAGDLLILLANWGNPYGASDLLALLADWGACP